MLLNTCNLYENDDIKVVVRSVLVENNLKNRYLNSTIYFCNKTANPIHDCIIYFEN
jgi:hypothetical protein